MSYSILDKINNPADLKALEEKELASLCEELRVFLLDKVGKSGGHLASNLGVVELSVALHRVFNSPKDHIIFDVGHQAYVHKILTGRKDRFDDLRKPGGLSGFTSMRESEHDPFGAGHSSTSISSALGYAEGDKLKGTDAHTVCVIGDGAYTGGMAHEAINNCHPDLRLIIVLNENGMSISSNKGAFANYLSRVRSSRGYSNLKRRTWSFLSYIPLLGKGLTWLISALKRGVKKLIFRSNYFEDLGFYYIGPIDGNNCKRVERALEKAKRLNKCVIVHLKTTKGKGSVEAENAPDEYHSVTSSAATENTYHSVFADELVRLAEGDNSIVGVTAAMGLGTGLSALGERYPDRYFDVGIAEEHALTFSAGLAANGLKPFAAIYSTFLQRGYDNLIHDIALQGLPVRLFIDRAGIAASDGATHHGIFDVSFLSHIPNMKIYAPAVYSSLRESVRVAAESTCPIAVRYPNASQSESISAFYEKASGATCDFKYDFDITNPPECIYVTYGKLCERVIAAQEILAAEGKRVGIILVEKIKPYAPVVEFLASFVGSDTRIVYAEEGIKNGGAGMITRDKLCEAGALCRDFRVAAIDDNFVIPESICDIYDYAGLSARALADYFR